MTAGETCFCFLIGILYGFLLGYFTGKEAAKEKDPVVKAFRDLRKAKKRMLAAAKAADAAGVPDTEGPQL